jgi:hypothetical protein
MKYDALRFQDTGISPVHMHVASAADKTGQQYIVPDQNISTGFAVAMPSEETKRLARLELGADRGHFKMKPEKNLAGRINLHPGMPKSLHRPPETRTTLGRRPNQYAALKKPANITIPVAPPQTLDQRMRYWNQGAGCFPTLGMH